MADPRSLPPDRARRPIFVLGMQRSGTTWVANMLAAHPRVAAVTAVRHRGVHESIFFSHFARTYGDIAVEANFERFFADFVSCEYFQLTGLDAEMLRAGRPRSYVEAFRLVMDLFAARRQATHWVEKSPHHTAWCDELATWFPDAQFVALLRDPVAQSRSRLYAYGRMPPSGLRRRAALIKAGCAIGCYRALIEAFAEQHAGRCMLLRFERLCADWRIEASRLATFLELEGPPDLFTPQFVRNSSFSDQTSPPDLSFPDSALVRVADTMSHVFPTALARSLVQRRRDAEPIWPNWCWRGSKPFAAVAPSNPNQLRENA